MPAGAAGGIGDTGFVSLGFGIGEPIRLIVPLKQPSGFRLDLSMGAQIYGGLSESLEGDGVSEVFPTSHAAWVQNLLAEVAGFIPAQVTQVIQSEVPVAADQAAAEQQAADLYAAQVRSGPASWCY